MVITKIENNKGNKLKNMFKEEIRIQIANAGYEESLFYDNFPDITPKDTEEYENAFNEAIEWIEYNTIRATPYAGPFAPVVIQYNPEYSEENKEEDVPQYINMINGEPYNYDDIVYRISE